MYVNELSKGYEVDQNDKNFCFLTPKNPGNEDEHTSIQRCILKEKRELSKKEKLDLKKDEQSKTKLPNVVKRQGLLTEGND